ncbi:(2,3-dihydroxybenzoyl)adenylate synthase [Actinoallomurus spadix]|uniref:(2,3-dihydroxybenzoyl)adenylate synthase n=1 Tax=Actinoallomurus spadix TaxID=79912 RepID=A0ABN0WE14_9ACTN|nr:(2,3-dihydroxybenzoyl)adenylate synthase [Actinoallomurus spadix]MCO5987220.1 (2,3-dihydroxybenzoyl)adenylate synthase [Actinoallomurus spadix]
MKAHPTWSDADAERYRRAGYWSGRTFGSYLRSWAEARPERVALVDGDHSWTYAELDTAADRLALGFQRLGIERGDRVVVQLPNRAEFVLVWFGLQRIGAVPVHAMPGHRRTEIEHMVRVSDAAAYIIPGRHARFDYRELARELVDDMAKETAGAPLRHVVVCGDPGAHRDFTGLEDLYDRTAPPSTGPTSGSTPRHAGEDGADSSDLALLLLSGGTTGLPKLVQRTHDDYAYNARAAADICALGEDSVYLAVLPIAFNFTLACPGVLGTLMSGGTVVVCPDPSPQTALRLIDERRVTITSLSPPLVPYWLEEAEHGHYRLDSLRILQVGGARLADEMARRIGPALGAQVQQVFGMAEGLINLTRLDDPEDLICTTQGRPISPDDELLIVDADGRPVTDGEPGELLTRGPYTPCGYYRAEAHNRIAFTADGFYRTGDLVRRTPSGNLEVVGRIKDQINRGGEKIAATEVEEHLLTHPAVTAAALVGAPDAQWGERPVAFLVCQGQAPSTRELASFLKQRGLAAYKTPDDVIAVDRLPLTAVGKIDKNALLQRLPRL